LPDKDFNPMTGSEDSRVRESSISNRRSASSDQNDLQGDPKRSTIDSSILLLMIMLE